MSDEKIDKSRKAYFAEIERKHRKAKREVKEAVQKALEDAAKRVPGFSTSPDLYTNTNFPTPTEDYIKRSEKLEQHLAEMGASVILPIKVRMTYFKEVLSAQKFTTEDYLYGLSLQRALFSTVYQNIDGNPKFTEDLATIQSTIREHLLPLDIAMCLRFETILCASWSTLQDHEFGTPEYNEAFLKFAEEETNKRSSDFSKELYTPWLDVPHDIQGQYLYDDVGGASGKLAISAQIYFMEGLFALIELLTSATQKEAYRYFLDYYLSREVSRTYFFLDHRGQIEPGEPITSVQLLKALDKELEAVFAIMAKDDNPN